MNLARVGKFPHSAQLFKFCHRTLLHKYGKRVNDQEVGAILGFNPSDCSHWKRGKKNVRSVFALEKLAGELGVEVSLIYDIVSGVIDIDEAYYEYQQSLEFRDGLATMHAADPVEVAAVRKRCKEFVADLHSRGEFVVPPLYLPEVMLFFPFISSQAVDIIDKISRILRVKSGQYCIQFRRGDIKSQTRLSIVGELARILFQGERSKFPELGSLNENLLKFEQHTFMAELLAPKTMLKREMQRLDARRNMVSELASLFWVPRSLISYQMQDILRLQPPRRLESAEKVDEAGQASVFAESVRL